MTIGINSKIEVKGANESEKKCTVSNYPCI